MLYRRSLLGGLAVAPVALQALAARPARAGSRAGSCAGPNLTPAIIAEIDALADRLMTTFDIVGAGVAVFQDGQVAYSRGFGVRDLESGKPFTPDTIHRVGSTTKSMTSMLAAMQVEAGLFDWETKLSDITDLFHFPSADLTDDIKIRQLMGMGTGLSESPIEFYLDLDSPEYFLKILPTLPVLYPPFTNYYYNDFVYAVAGFAGLLKQGVAYSAVERAYAATMQSSVFGPIGMTTAAITDNPSNLGRNVSKSYGYDLRSGVSPDRLMPYQPVRMVSPAGATACSLTDMTRYLITQMNGGITPDGRRVVSRDLLMRTWQQQTPITATAGYGMGWVNGLVDGDINLIYHTGGVDAFKTEIDMLPESGVGIVTFSNTETGGHFNSAIRGRLIELLYCRDAKAVDAQIAHYDDEKKAIAALKASVTGYTVPFSEVKPVLGSYAKGWRVVYSDGLPIMTRTFGARLVLLPTATGYCVASGTESGAFQDSINFIPAGGGGMRLVISAPNGTIVDDLPRLHRDG